MKKTMNNKKEAMSIMTILASMIVVMILIVAATPVITRRLTHINNGGNARTIGQTGAYICYRQGNQLFQLRRELQNNGDETNRPQQVEQCTFDIPGGSDNFRITLIGGGGGGAATNADLTRILHSQDDIVFGVNNVTINPFVGTEYESAVTVNMLNTFLRASNPKPTITVTGLNRGLNGASCTATLNNIGAKGGTISYHSGTPDAPDGYITYELRNARGDISSRVTLTAVAGLPATLKFTNDAELEQEVSGLECLTNRQCLVQNSSALGGARYNARDGSANCIQTGNFSANFTMSAAAIAGDNPGPIIPGRINTKLETLTIRAFIPTVAAQPGQIIQTEANVIGAGQIVIPIENLGAGGNGGTIGNCETGICSGQRGGDTILNLNNGVALRAQGGNGVANIEPTVWPRNVRADDIAAMVSPGLSGESTALVFPALLTQGLSDIGSAIGNGGATNCNNVNNARIQACNASSAELMGAGGGNASLFFSLRNAPLSLVSPDIEAGRRNAGIQGGNGGRGADGAIIIEW